MLSRQRQTAIIAELHRTGAVKVSDLMAQFDVSDMTVRRDLNRLAMGGLVEKVHGGAVLLDTVTAEAGFAANHAVAWPAKQAIASEALRMVDPGTAIALSAGTTTWAMAEGLARMSPLTVITNSTTIAETMAACADLHESGPHVVLTGGWRTPSAALVGPHCESMLRTLTVDTVFIGVHGLSEAAGLTTPNMEEASANRTMLSRSRRVIALADGSKWGCVGLATFAELHQIDVLITDTSIHEVDPDALGVLAARGVDVRVVVPFGDEAT